MKRWKFSRSIMQRISFHFLRIMTILSWNITKLVNFCTYLKLNDFIKPSELSSESLLQQLNNQECPAYSYPESNLLDRHVPVPHSRSRATGRRCKVALANKRNILQRRMRRSIENSCREQSNEENRFYGGWGDDSSGGWEPGNRTGGGRKKTRRPLQDTTG